MKRKQRKRNLKNNDMFKEKNLGCKGADGCILYIPKQVFHSCTRIRIHKRKGSVSKLIKFISLKKTNKNEP